MQQNVIPFETHKLPIERVDSHALYVMDKLQHAGFVAYLVGGSVRDLLLERTPKDYDISTSAKPEEIKKLFRNCILIGRRFRLAHIRFGKKILEVSTFRRGDPEKEELILQDNQWGYPEEDVLRRDFTINGLFYDPATQTIIDYVGGYEDLKKKYLRTIGQPFVRFKQDPVRMLRLLKFQARFGFEVDPDAHIALVECREEIVKSAPARVLEELLRMLESGASKHFIELLNFHGMMNHLIPELSHFIEKNENGEAVYTYLDEVDSIFQDPSEKKLDRAVLLSSLAYPLLEERLERLFLSREKIPHLGQIERHTRDLIDEVFQSFFLVPRRLKIGMNNILTGQYRLTPFQKKRGPKRIPRSSDFDLALTFLRLRSCIEPGLQVVHEEWSDIYKQAMEGTEEEKPRKRSRRPRRPRKKGKTKST